VLSVVDAPGARAIVRIDPSREAIVSWNASAPEGRIDLAVYRVDGKLSEWLPYVSWDGDSRRSHSGRDDVAEIEKDIVRAGADIVAIEVRSDVALDLLAISTPVYSESRRTRAERTVLDVPARSQYMPQFPNERGWCSPTSLAMLLAYWGRTLDVPDVAERVRDASYGGTGNWTFNTALAGTLGLHAAVVHLRDLEAAERMIAAGIPLALSFAWEPGQLPNAPIEHTDGHLAVLCGFDATGDPIVNDPAQHAIRTPYPRAAFERAWRGHGGIAYVVTSPDHATLAEVATHLDER
jgi:hypothetical protein